MMLGWLIYTKRDAYRNKSYIEWFIHEAKKQNITLKLIFREDLQIGIIHQKSYLAYQKKVITLPDFAVIRTVEPLLNKQLENLGIPCFNSYEVSDLCNHKMKTYLAMNELNIPTMNTLMLKRDHQLDHAPMAFPFVIKEATGRGGKQVYLIENERMWKDAFHQFTTEDLILQSTDVQQGKDLRVFVLGKDIIQAVLRINEGKFRANYSLGGRAEPYELSKEEIQLIDKIIKTYDFDLVGIDFLIDNDGRLVFNEIEDVVGSRILSAVSDINLLEKYVKHIIEKLNP